MNRNDVSGDAGLPLVTRPDGSQFIADVPRDRRYSTPQDFALSYDHNVRTSYGHTFGNGMGVRNITGYRVYDDEYWITETLRVTYPSTVNRTFLYFKHEQRPFTNQLEFSGPVRLLRQSRLPRWGGTSRLTAAAPPAWTARRWRRRRSTCTTRSRPTSRGRTSRRHATTTSRNFTNGLLLQDHMTLTSQLKAVVGARFDNVRRYTNNNPVANGVETEVAGAGATRRRPTQRVGLGLPAGEQVDVYAQYATGFKPNFNLQPDGSTLEPEFGVSYEAGQRLRLMRDRIQLNTTLFNITKRNVTFSRPGGIFEQVGKVRSRGFEADLDARVSPAFSMNLGYGYTDAEYVDYRRRRRPISPATGRRAPRPTRSASPANYTWNNRLSLMAGTQFRDTQFLNDQNTLTLDSFSLVNLAASYVHRPDAVQPQHDQRRRHLLLRVDSRQHAVLPGRASPRHGDGALAVPVRVAAVALGVRLAQAAGLHPPLARHRRLRALRRLVRLGHRDDVRADAGPRQRGAAGPGAGARSVRRHAVAGGSGRESRRRRRSRPGRHAAGPSRLPVRRPRADDRLCRHGRRLRRASVTSARRARWRGATRPATPARFATRNTSPSPTSGRFSRAARCRCTASRSTTRRRRISTCPR